MGLFNSRRPPLPPPPPAAGPIPVLPVDVTKRYDVYCSDVGHDRLYEAVRFVGIRSFERISEFGSGFIDGFLEIETPDGARVLIPRFGIRLICEHGTPPRYKILRHRRYPRGD